jgi:gas vesicle protein
MAEANNKRQTGKLIAIVVTGVLLGAVAGILLAPKSGKQTRELLSTRFKNAAAKLSSRSSKTGAKAIRSKTDPTAVPVKRKRRSRKIKR